MILKFQLDLESKLFVHPFLHNLKANSIVVGCHITITLLPLPPRQAMHLARSAQVCRSLAVPEADHQPLVVEARRPSPWACNHPPYSSARLL